jgi:hypothetical protein
MATPFRRPPVCPAPSPLSPAPLNVPTCAKVGMPGLFLQHQAAKPRRSKDRAKSLLFPLPFKEFAHISSAYVTLLFWSSTQRLASQHGEAWCMQMQATMTL